MTDYDAMSISELISARAALDAAIEKRRKDLKRQLSELGSQGPSLKSHASESDQPKSKQVVKNSARTGKAPTMYRHPDTGETWSGRGRLARWLATEIAAGKAKDSFRI